MLSFNGLYNDFGAERNQFTIAGIYKYKETDSLNSLESSRVGL